MWLEQSFSLMWAGVLRLMIWGSYQPNDLYPYFIPFWFWYGMCLDICRFCCCNHRRIRRHNGMSVRKKWPRRMVCCTKPFQKRQSTSAVLAEASVRIWIEWQEIYVGADIDYSIAGVEVISNLTQKIPEKCVRNHFQSETSVRVAIVKMILSSSANRWWSEKGYIIIGEQIVGVNWNNWTCT